MPRWLDYRINPKTPGGHERRIDWLEKRPHNGPYYPMHQSIGLNAVLTFGYTGGGVSIVQDATVWTNHYISIPTDSYISFMFMLGPQFAVHEIVFSHLLELGGGSMHGYMARLSEDGDDGYGYSIPDELITDISQVSPTWVDVGSISFVGASNKNVVGAYGFRIMGDDEADFTTLGVDPDSGQGSVDGGAGLYVMQLVADSGPIKISQIDITRIVAPAGWV